MFGSDQGFRGDKTEPGASITGFFTTMAPGTQRSTPREVTYVPPAWLLEPASDILADLQAAGHVDGLQITAYPIDDLNGLTLGVAEPIEVSRKRVQLPDDLDPDLPTEYGGGNWVPRSLTGPSLLVLIADLLQEDLAETSVCWGQSRPPCPTHHHPARPVLLDSEAWWICPRDHNRLYRIGRGEVPHTTESLTEGRKESRRARKRHHR